MHANLPTQEPAEPIRERRFTAGGLTYVYNPDLITMEQAIIADEALQFKLELMNRDVASFTAVLEAGGVEWFAKCAGALLVRVEGDVPVPYSPAQWSQAVRFVQTLPYAQMPALKECLEDFFSSIGRGKGLSYVLSERSKMTSNRVVSDLLKIMASKQLG
jgi:hypothetical protein